MEEKEKTDDQSLVENWCKRVAASEKRKEDYIDGTDRIVKRYRNDKRTNRDSLAMTVTRSSFNIYWSTVQVMMPGVFSRVPKPEVRRRYLDKDAVGKVASMALEKNISNQCEDYDFVRVGENCANDFLLRGMCVAWVRYVSENETVTPDKLPTIQLDEDVFATPDGRTVSGEEVDEDVFATPDGRTVSGEEVDEDGFFQPPDYEQLAYESVVVDYIPIEDFDCSEEPLWEDKWWISRKHSFTRSELIENFGEIGRDVPLNYEHDTNKEITEEDQTKPKEAAVHEIWDERRRKVIWVAKYWPEKPLKVEDDPYGLEGFFPVARPAMGTTTPDEFLPIPDYVQVEDIVNTIDETAKRIYGIVPTLKVTFGYDPQIPELARIFEGDDGEGIPLQNWDKFAQQGGIQGSVDFLPLKENITTLDILSRVFDQQKAWFYEIFGVSDIMRGATDPRETASAQKLKSQYGGMRLSTKRREFARFLRDIIRIKAELISENFSYETFALAGGIEEMDPQDQQLLPAAYELLQQQTVRDWRIDIQTDSTAEEDEMFERQAMNEYIQAATGVIKLAGQTAPGAPEFLPYLGGLAKAGARRYKAGRDLEAQLDIAIDQATQRAQQEFAQQQQQKQKGDPKEKAAMGKLQLQQQKQQVDAQLKAQKQQADNQIKMLELQLQAEQAEKELALERLELATKVELQREKQRGDITKEAVKAESKRASELAKINQVQ